MDRKAVAYKGMPPNIMVCNQEFRVLPNGDWIIVFFTGGAFEPARENHIRIVRSSDGGESWSEPEVVLQSAEWACSFTEVMVDQDRITIFALLHDGRHGNWRNATLVSRDSGRTWREPVPFAPCLYRTHVRNRCVTSWNEWVMPLNCYPPTAGPGVTASIRDDGSFEHPFNAVLISADRGRTWTQHGHIEPAHGWAENTVVELSNDRLAMLIRYDGAGCLYRSDSLDRGRTWNAAHATSIPNPNNKVLLLRVPDGRVALVHTPNSGLSHPMKSRTLHPERNPLSLWISDDNMETWSWQRILTDFPGAHSYPGGIVDPGGSCIRFAFDYNRHDLIYWAAEIPSRSS